MIQITRGSKSEPAVLRGPAAKQAQEKAAQFFSSRSRATLQSEHEFDQHLLRSKPVTAALGKVFSDRCAFCGRGIEARLEIHHFRPAEGAVGADGQTSRRHYWWLAYAWENLYLACSECSTAQGQKFPVGGTRARVRSGTEALANEGPVLIDPCAENPEDDLVYLDTGEVVAREARPKTTIDTFQLNRPRLVRDRAEAMESLNWDLGQVAEALRSDYEEFIRLLFELYSRDKPLAGLRRQRINQWVQFRPRKVESAFRRVVGSTEEYRALTEGMRRVTNQVKADEAYAFFGEAARFYLQPELLEVAKRAAPAKPSVPMRERNESGTVEPFTELPFDAGLRPWTYFDSAEIRSIEIRNFRAIESLSIKLAGGVGSWLMLLGENGTGKSSILQAIALALSDSRTIKAHSKDARHLLRKGADWGSIRVELTSRQRFRELRFGEGYNGFEADRPMEGVLVAGYGATRLLPRSKKVAPAASRIEGLFDPFVPLTLPSSWLPRLEEDQFDAVARALKRLLNLADDETMRLVDDDLYLVKGRRRLRLSDLSDGYQAMAGFGLDLMELFLTRWGTLESAEGVVLVDELGAHLHPRWQMQATRALRDAFPRAQFIATTHDPLCLHGLWDGEVALLRRNEDHIYALHQELPPIEGLTVDQILTSEHFGLHSTREPAVENLINDYYRLLGKHTRSEREEDELDQARARLDAFRLLGSTRREQLALEAADDFLAGQRQLESAAEYTELHDATVRRIQGIWERRLR
jgi:uncharacterized protein (TIGR02646 family)